MRGNRRTRQLDFSEATLTATSKVYGSVSSNAILAYGMYGSRHCPYDVTLAEIKRDYWAYPWVIEKRVTGLNTMLPVHCLCHKDRDHLVQKEIVFHVQFLCYNGMSQPANSQPTSLCSYYICTLLQSFFDILLLIFPSRSGKPESISKCRIGVST